MTADAGVEHFRALDGLGPRLLTGGEHLPGATPHFRRPKTDPTGALSPHRPHRSGGTRSRRPPEPATNRLPIVGSTDHPTTLRRNRSSTTAKDTHSRVGREGDVRAPRPVWTLGIEVPIPDARRGDGVDCLVNTSNDGWFDGTEEHEQHLAIGRFRAVEARRSVLRAVNMGISGLIDPDGRVAVLPNETGWGASKKSRGVVRVDVPLSTSGSVYAAFGDWVPGLCWLGVAVGLIAARRAARRTPTPRVD